VTKSHKQFEQKLNKRSAKKSLKNKTKEGKIKSSMQIFRRRAQSTVRKSISKTIKRQLNLDSLDLRHKSQIKGDINIIESVESEGGGESGEEEEEVESVTWGPVICAKLVKKILLILDVNETLLWNEFRPVRPGSTRGEYTKVVFRPFLLEFLQHIKNYVGVDIMLWTGARTEEHSRVLLGHLNKFDLYDEDLVLQWGEMPVCRTNKYYSDNPNKMIVIKPVVLVKQVLCEAYKHVLLVDNNIEKSLGFSQRYVNGVPVANKHSRLRNLEEEHYELKSFRGEDTDTELNPITGVGALGLWKRIKDLQTKYVIDLT